MTRILPIFAALGLLGLGCALAYSLVGQPLEADGILQASFLLIPMGYFMMALGFGGALIISLGRLLSRTLRHY